MGKKIGDAFIAVKAETDKGVESSIRSRFMLSGRKAGLGFGASFKAGLAPVLAGIGGLFAATKAVDFVKGIIGAASDMNETQSKVNTIFGKSAAAINAWADTAATGFGQSKQEAEDAAATFSVFGKAAGLTGGKLVKFSEGLAGLAGDLASFSNTSPQEALQAIQSGLQGEAEPLRKYGILLDDASLRQEALALGIVKTTKTALTPQQRVLAAQALIFKQTKTQQGDFARTSGGLANQQRILAAQFDNVKTKLGQGLLPIALRVVKLFSGMLPILLSFGSRAGAAFDVAKDKAVQFVKGIDWSPFIRLAQTVVKVVRDDLAPGLRDIAISYGPMIKAVLVGAFAALWGAVNALSPVLSTVGGALKAIFGFIADNKPTVLTFVGVLVAYQLALKAIALYGRIVTAVQIAWSAAMAASPIGLVVVGIAALAAGIVFLATRTRFFQALWGAVWGGLKAAFSATVGFLRSKLGLIALALGPIGAIAWIAANWSTVWGLVTGAISGARDVIMTVVRTIVMTFLNMVGAIIHGAAKAFGWVPGIGGKLKSAAKAFDKFKNDVNRSLGGIKDQDVNIQVHYLGTNKIPAGLLHGIGVMAEGGIVKARPGGTLKILGEAGQDEAVVPLPNSSVAGGGDVAGLGGMMRLHPDDLRALAELLGRVVIAGIGAGGGVTGYQAFRGAQGAW
jgi:hypothetical protein